MKKTILWLLLLYPVFVLTYNFFFGSLGANPIDLIIDTSGEYALGILALTLAMTPLRNVFKDAEFSKFKRLFGLFFFFYATVHMMTHVGLDHRFNWAEIWAQTIKNKYILVGFIAWFAALPLALTSNQWSIRLLKKKWKVLHKVTYGVAILSIVHYIWLARTIYWEPILWSGLIALLLLTRVKQPSEIWNEWFKPYIGKVIFFGIILFGYNYIVKNLDTTAIPNPTETEVVQEVNGAYYQCYHDATVKGIVYEEKLLLCDPLWKEVKDATSELQEIPKAKEDS